MILYQAGNEEAFRLLYKKNSSKIYGFLLNRLKNPETANDIFQATFLKLHRGRHLYNKEFPFMPWLFTICRNAMNDHLRKKTRAHEVFSETAMENATVPQCEIPDFSMLNNTQKQAIEMRYLKGFSFEEISKALNTSTSNARQLISRAVRKIKGNANEKN